MIKKLFISLLLIGFVVFSNAQQISGLVKSITNETIAAATVSIKNSNIGTFTNDKGKFLLKVNKQYPFTIVVSCIGYSTEELIVQSNSQPIIFNLKPKYELGQEVVVSASRVPEKILVSPVSIERISAANIRNAAAPGYFDMLTNLKGVDAVTASYTFKSITTRGFNSSGNVRLNQLVDGMDNQSPGLNFSVGTIVGLNALDIDNIELLQGASSALYGSGGMNGTLLINGKNPFKYQGLSFEVKQGLNHFNSNREEGPSPFYDWSVRWAQKISDKFAYKIGAQYIQIVDWLASDERDYDRTNISNTNPFGKIINKKDRFSDLNYDGINVYGDETKVQISDLLGGLQSLLAIPKNTFPGVDVAIPVPLSVLSPVTNSIASQYISRTGFAEKNLVDPISSNFKFNLGLNYKLTPNTELSYNGYYGSGNAVYTGADRYVLKNFSIQQHKLELKNANWYLRAYITTEDAGNTYNATAAGRLFNEAISPSATWYPTLLLNSGLVNTVTPFATQAVGVYGASLGAAFQSATIASATSLGGQAAGAAAYGLALAAGKTPAEALAAAQAAAQEYGIINGGKPALSNPTNLNNAKNAALAFSTNYANANPNLFSNLNTGLNNARKIADANRPAGSVINDARFQQIINTPISNGGAGLIDKSNLIVLDGQYNISEKLNLKKYGLDWLVGGTFKQYSLKSGNTIFSDAAGLNINEYGAYTQISKNFFDDGLKIAASGRYDKQTNFDGRFTPRVSAVIKLAQDQHIRLSYQTAYRFPTNQDQYIDLAAGSGILLGGVQSLKDKYNFSTNKVYTQESFAAFAYSALAGAPNPTLLKEQTFSKFQPESNTSFEIGYKGLFDKKILIDFYYYVGVYNNLLTRTNVFQSKDGSIANLLTSYQIYSLSTNSPQEVNTSGWGVSLDYLLPNNFTVGANAYSDVIGDLPEGFTSFFNTPKLRFNVNFANSGFWLNKRLGFNIVGRWQDDVNYEGTFVTGYLPAFGTVDAAITFKLPQMHSIIKLGGTNIINHYYRNALGSPSVGGLYYVSFAYNVF